MSRKHKPVNDSGIPQHIIESIARCILPDIIAYYETEEGRGSSKNGKQCKKWKRRKERKVKRLIKLKGHHHLMVPFFVAYYLPSGNPILDRKFANLCDALSRNKVSTEQTYRSFLILYSVLMSMVKNLLKSITEGTIGILSSKSK